MAPAVSFVWLGEVPHAIELVGGAVSVAGVILINRRTADRRSSGSVDAAASQGTAERADRRTLTR